MRTRSSQTLNKLPDAIRTYTPTGGPPSPTWLGRGTDAGTFASITDTVTPNYRQLRKQGAIIMNDMSMSRTVITSSGVTSCDASDQWGSTKLEGDMMSIIQGVIPSGGGTHFSIGQGSAVERVLVNAYAAMNKSPIISAEIMSDLSKTVSMLRRPFGNAVTLLKSITQKRDWHLRRKSMTVAKANASAWLEYRYGWQPLLMDGAEIVKQTEKICNRSNSGIRVARNQVRSSDSASESYSGSLVGYTFKGTKTSAASLVASAGVIYRVSDSSIAEQAQRAAGLKLRDVAPSIWELVPYSFVVDWFVNVGPWIEALSPRPDITVLGSWTTYVWNSSVDLPSATITRKFGSPAVDIYGSSNSLNSKWFNYSRVKNPSLPFTPSLTCKPISTTHLADALALSTGKITQLLGGLRRQ